MRTEVTNTRLTIDLPSDMHRLIKARATIEDLSIKDFIIETIEKRFSEEKVSKNQMNAKTIATIRDSIKNHDKLKTFSNSTEAMKWLLSDNTKVKKSKKKNERN